MAKSKAYSSIPSRKAGKAGGREASESYKDRNLAGMTPEKAQESFKPTDAEPVSLHKKMAGC